MWGDSSTPEERVLYSERQRTLRAFLDPEQPGLDDEARGILRFLRDRQDDEHIQYEELAALIGRDRTNAGRRVKRLLLEQLPALWGLGVVRMPTVERLLGVLTERGGHRGFRE